MRGKVQLTLVVAVTVIATGCLAGEEVFDADTRPEWEGQGRAGHNGDQMWAERVLADGEGHDHRDPEQHMGLTTPNFYVMGWDPLITDHHNRTSGSYFCGEAREAEDGRRYSFVHSFWSDVALTVADVTDPLKPFIVGELVMPLTHVYDTAATPDARYVILATSPLDTGPDPEGLADLAPSTPIATFRDACTGEERPVDIAPRALADAGPEENAPLASGVVLVDVTDVTNPRIADYRPLPALGAHSVFATNVDGKDLVLASVTNLVHYGSYFAFFSILETPAGATLAPESLYRPVTTSQPIVINGHMDGWIAKHPVTNKTLAYLADWDGGMVIVDVTNPKLPIEVGRWSDYTYGDGNNGGNIHGTLPMETLWKDGRHYTFVGQEVTARPRDRPSGLVNVIDTTDPTQPKRVGAWTLPVDVEWSGTLMFSTHYFRLQGSTLFVAMYHGGVWAVDLADITKPRAVGAFVPDRVSPAPPGALDRNQYDWAPTILDLEVFDDGPIIVWDGTSGVWTLHFKEEHRFYSPEPWPVPV